MKFFISLLSILTLNFAPFLAKNKIANYQNEEFKRDLPDDGMGKGSLFQSLAFISDSLKLDTLENGYDSLQIRLWFVFPGVTFKQQLIILKIKRVIGIANILSLHRFIIMPIHFFILKKNF